MRKKSNIFYGTSSHSAVFRWARKVAATNMIRKRVFRVRIPCVTLPRRIFRTLFEEEWRHGTIEWHSRENKVGYFPFLNENADSVSSLNFYKTDCAPGIPTYWRSFSSLFVSLDYSCPYCPYRWLEKEWRHNLQTGFFHQAWKWHPQSQAWASWIIRYFS